MRLILAGGFLGSGKTTAIQKACSLLSKQNIKVANEITITLKIISYTQIGTH